MPKYFSWSMMFDLILNKKYIYRLELKLILPPLVSSIFSVTNFSVSISLK